MGTRTRPRIEEILTPAGLLGRNPPVRPVPRAMPHQLRVVEPLRVSAAIATDLAALEQLALSLNAGELVARPI